MIFTAEGNSRGGGGTEGGREGNETEHPNRKCGKESAGISTDEDMHACQAVADVLVCFGRNSKRK